MNINRHNVSKVLASLSAAQRTVLDDWAKAQIANNLTCQTSLVEDLLSSEKVEGFRYDEVRNLHLPLPNEDDIEAMGAEELVEYIREADAWRDFLKSVDANDYLSITVGDGGPEMDEVQKDLVDRFLTGDQTVLEEHFAGWFDLYGYVEEMATFVKGLVDGDDQDPQEIYEWWLVTDSWIAEKLEELGEPILDHDFGTWWGRTCTGQAIWLDQAIQKVYLMAFGKPQTEEEKKLEQEEEERYQQYAEGLRESMEGSARRDAALEAEAEKINRGN